MNPALTRDDLIARLSILPPNARGRGEIERLLAAMTNVTLVPPSEPVPAIFKPRVRVPALRGRG